MPNDNPTTSESPSCDAACSTSEYALTDQLGNALNDLMALLNIYGPCPAYQQAGEALIAWKQSKESRNFLENNQADQP